MRLIGIVASLAVVVSSLSACEGLDDGSDQQTSSSLLFRFRPPPGHGGAGGSPSHGGAGGHGGAAAATGGSGGAVDINAVIKAAQTPDGQAIPQPPGPNGECPEVLVLLGFWSCPTIGQTCTYTASGVHHACACDRTDGEGQSPSWVCDQ
jgi:hypothetical protein